MILETTDFKTEMVPTPEWPDADGKVFCRSIMASDRDAYESSFSDKDGKSTMENIRSRLVVMSACDENGKLIFSHDDVESLGKKNAEVVNRLWDAARKLAGMTDEDAKELEKNSESPPEDSSSSS